MLEYLEALVSLYLPRRRRPRRKLTCTAAGIVGTICWSFWLVPPQVKATREAAARGRLHVLSADGRLVPAAGCVHIRTAGRALLQRCACLVPLPREALTRVSIGFHSGTLPALACR